MRQAAGWAADFAALTRHVYRLWRTGQLRFRLETFGVYYPNPQYTAPWWRVSPVYGWMLVRRAPDYAAWVREMDALRREGAEGWWMRHAARKLPIDVDAEYSD